MVRTGVVVRIIGLVGILYTLQLPLTFHAKAKTRTPQASESLNLRPEPLPPLAPIRPKSQP